MDVTKMWTTFTLPLSENKIYGEGPGIYVIKDGDEQVTAKVDGIPSIYVGKTRYVSGLFYDPINRKTIIS